MTAKKKKIVAAIAVVALIVCLTVGIFIASAKVMANGRQNFLVFATDDRREFTDDAHADMILGVTLNRKTKEIGLVNFYRNIKISEPDESSDGIVKRLKDAYTESGAAGLKTKVEELSGLTFGPYVRINLSTVQKAVDTLGGLDVEITEDEARYMNKYNPEISYPKLNSPMDGVRFILDEPVHEGLNHLDGTAAVVYARCRNIDGDIERMDRYRTVFEKMLEKVRNLDKAETVRLVLKVSESVQTDADLSEVSALAGILPEISGWRLKYLSIPGESGYKEKEYDGIYVCEIEPEKIKAELEKFAGR